MAGIQLSGLASGLDWQSLVDKLIEAERTPETQLRTEQSKSNQKNSALTTLTTQLTNLQTSIASLTGTSNAFAARTATLSDSSAGFTATAGSDTEISSHTFDVIQLATRAKSLGVAGQGKPLSATGDVSGITLATMPSGTAIKAGDFTVNGSRVTIATTDSLQDVFDKISTATGGVVSASYNPATDKVTLAGTGEVILGSANDSSNFLAAMGLFNNGTNSTSSSGALGTVSLTKSLANANLKNAITAVDGNGDGSFTINGVAISFNANTDSLSGIFARINSSTAGVTASYDRATDRFVLTNKTTGDSGLAVSEAAGGFLSALGLNAGATLQRGLNAQVSVDGGPAITSSSNTFDSSVHGIAGLSLTATKETDITVTVGTDTASLKAKIKDFVDKYNGVQDYIDAQTKSSTTATGTVSNGVLAGNREITDIASALRSRIFSAVPGLTGSIQRMEAIGIDFTGTSSKLTIKDEAKLDAALTSNPNEVEAMLSGQPNGIAARLDTYIKKITAADTGTIPVQSNTITKRSADIDKQIADMERRIAQQKELLTNSFIRMESAQQQISSQLSALNNALGTTSSK